MPLHCYTDYNCGHAQSQNEHNFVYTVVFNATPCFLTTAIKIWSPWPRWSNVWRNSLIHDVSLVAAKRRTGWTCLLTACTWTCTKSDAWQRCQNDMSQYETCHRCPGRRPYEVQRIMAGLPECLFRNTQNLFWGSITSSAAAWLSTTQYETHDLQETVHTFHSTTHTSLDPKPVKSSSRHQNPFSYHPV
jgi:hypothetical protein